MLGLLSIKWIKILNHIPVFHRYHQGCGQGRGREPPGTRPSPGRSPGCPRPGCRLQTWSRSRREPTNQSGRSRRESQQGWGGWEPPIWDKASQSENDTITWWPIIRQCFYLIPEWMHHIVTERTSVFGAIFVGVETTEYLGSKVGIVKVHFNSNILLIKLAFFLKNS